MKFLKNDGTYMDLLIHEDYTPDVNVNYELVELSTNSFIPVDRGYLTDRYATSVKFINRYDYIASLITELNLLRDNKKSLKLSDFQENIFGDNLDYTLPLDTLIFDFGDTSYKSFNVYQFSLKLLATDVKYKAGGSLPTGLRCINHAWSGYSKWDTHINETYNRHNYFVDRQSDTYTFKGKYILSIDDNADLFNFWKTQRGNAFVINESDFGVTNMFGPDGGTGSHNVIIKDIKYKKFSPIYRTTEIEMIKVDD